MTYQVRVNRGDITFPCGADETLLDAAERAGFSLPYSCRKGVCSTCEGGLIAGKVGLRVGGMVEGPQEAVLLCQARPRSDLEIAPQRIEKHGTPARKTLTATVYRLTGPTPDVSILQLRFPAGTRVKFRAGQYLQVMLEDGDRRNFSMANPPQQNDGAELHVRRVPGGRFSEAVLSELAPGSKLPIELPYGEFFLREESASPVILVATGTGFAPIKSIVEDALKRGSGRSMQLYWGARRRRDLYMPDLPQKWTSRAPWFSFVPVLSEPDDGWQGRTGLVHGAVLDEHPNLAGYQVYACGNPTMTAVARKEFVTRAGLSEGDFYCDAFVPSGEATN